MKIIRGELTPDVLTPPATRYDATCNCIQVTSDGGATWVDAVGQDPRSQPAYLKPPVAGSNKRCDAAANMTAWVKSVVDSLIAAMNAGATDLLLVNGLVQFIEQLFPYAAYFIQLMFELAVDVLALGAADLNTAFDSTTYDDLTCIFYCAADSNGLLNDAAYAQIAAGITTKLNTTAALVVSELLFITGFVGLSNAGATGSETGDCSACDCCPETYCTRLDFTLSNYGIGATLGTWVAGVGFEQAATFGDGAFYNGVWLGFTIEAGNITSISFEFSGSAGSGLAGFTDRIYFQADLSGNWVQTGESLVSSPFSVTGSWDGKTLLGVTLTCGHSNPASGTVTLTAVQVEGAGCSVVVGGMDCG